ncbi:hypothetical protein TorRG33x02_033200 [Trema orientale]|uniref:Uncharacterized protein n=1 Tax=Trema orientale TaxID=63057 RepID=A0A2P5FSE0_TREOI|nr:hypothetical protein TorRG33x02_033200 [Trema orientale]
MAKKLARQSLLALQQEENGPPTSTKLQTRLNPQV